MGGGMGSGEKESFVEPLAPGEYEAGLGDYLRNLDELAYYSLIAGYFRHLKPGGSLLDVGCGEGLLQQRLGPEAYRRYVGIDLSTEAIRRAAARADGKTCFLRADAREYDPGVRFDAIVFTETLYYLEDPGAELLRYRDFLEPGGLFLISMRDLESRHSLWDWLDQTFPVLDTVRVTNRSGTAWTIKVFQPG
ncbi:MAG: class I SAM-dependent methyltransferase [Candidatus Zixiibacteriota bacterium]|nr:MAG: class I SAM-dependent methyltransferase [candidate division Zixibacteria bacterium]